VGGFGGEGSIVHQILPGARILPDSPEAQRPTGRTSLITHSRPLQLCHQMHLTL
jgi:hypothetical protein